MATKKADITKKKLPVKKAVSKKSTPTASVMKSSKTKPKSKKDAVPTKMNQAELEPENVQDELKRRRRIRTKTN